MTWRPGDSFRRHLACDDCGEAIGADGDEDNARCVYCASLWRVSEEMEEANENFD